MWKSGVKKNGERRIERGKYSETNTLRVLMVRSNNVRTPAKLAKAIDGLTSRIRNQTATATFRQKCIDLNCVSVPFCRPQLTCSVVPCQIRNNELGQCHIWRQFLTFSVFVFFFFFPFLFYLLFILCRLFLHYCLRHLFLLF